MANLDHYKIPYTHQINLDGQQPQAYVLCPQIISPDLITSIPDVNPEKSIFKIWSFKYEFMKYFNIYINDIRGGNQIIKKENQNKKCPMCEYLIGDENEMNQIYYVPDVNYCFSPFIIHMMKFHDYKPPKKFIEYTLLRINSDYKYVNFEQDTLLFLKNFVNHNVFVNYKFINKTIGNIQRFIGNTVKFVENKYSNLINYPSVDKSYNNGISFGIIPEYNYNANDEVKYIESEITGYLNIDLSADKFYNIKKISVVNRIHDKDYQVQNGNTNGIYFFHPDAFSQNNVVFHTHPDYISTGNEFIIKRLINGKALFEIFSEADILSFMYGLKINTCKMSTSIIFTPEGIYQMLPDPNLNPYNITEQQIHQVQNEIGQFVAYISDYFRYSIVDKLENGKYQKNVEYHNMVYHENMFFNYIKNKLKSLDIILLFYPKEMKSDGTWAYGDIYLPFDDQYKNRLQQRLAAQQQQQPQPQPQPQPQQPPQQQDNQDDPIPNAEDPFLPIIPQEEKQSPHDNQGYDHQRNNIYMDRQNQFPYQPIPIPNQPIPIQNQQIPLPNQPQQP